MGLCLLVVSLRWGMVVMVMTMRFIINQFHTFREIKERKMRSVLFQAFHPCLLKSYVTNTQVCLPLTKVNKLLRCRIVCLRAASFGNHAHHLKTIAGNGFGKVTQWFYGDHDYWTVIVLFFACIG